MKSVFKKLNSRKGFTLVELVVVIAVLAILAGVGTVAYRGYITRAQDAKKMEYLGAVKTAVEAALAEKEATVNKIVISAGAAEPTVTLDPSTVTFDEDAKSLYATFMKGNDTNPLATGETATWEKGKNDDKWKISTGS